jgi:tetratricopeptide (TPR) repeat protein
MLISRNLLVRARAVCLIAGLCATSFAVLAQNASEYNSAGVGYYNQGRWDNAIQSFASAYNLAPDNETVRRNLCNAYQAQANALARTNDFSTAIDLLRMAISVEPQNPSPLAQLGSYYLRVDMVPDAIYRLEESLELDPASIDVQELLGDAYYKNNDLAAALAQWELVLEMNPNRQGLVDKLDKAYREESVEFNFRQTQSAHFRVSFAPGTSGGDLSRVLQILERAYRDIGRKFGGAYPPTPIQVILYTGDDFARATLLGEHVGAVYDGKIRVPIADRSGQFISQDELWRRLYHEYTHVVIRFWAGDNVPWWLNEGLAETFSNDMSSTTSALLYEAYTAGVLFTLNEMEESQLKKLDTDSLQLAYRQAHATASFLWNRYGHRGIAGIMERLAQGASGEDALIATCRLDYSALEREVVKNLGRTLSQR